MHLFKASLFVVLLFIGHTEQARGDCSNSLSTGNQASLCLLNSGASLAWSDAYSQCLMKTTPEVLIEISSMEQWTALKTATKDRQSLLWIGANNFASFHDSNWHWLDGSIVDSSVVTWCENSTRNRAAGAYCVAYDTALQCITNRVCSSPLPTACVTVPAVKIQQARALRSIDQTNTTYCPNSYNGAYAYWWTYSVLLINWFLLFCFVLYLINHFVISTRLSILTICITLVSLMMIIAFAVLWGIQYNNIVNLPIVVVSLGSAGALLLLITIILLVANRLRVRRWLPCVIVGVVILIIELGLFLGVCLCTAYCSGYLSLTSTTLDKDIIASLLASMAIAISILCVSIILYLLDDDTGDRGRQVRPTNYNAGPMPAERIASADPLQKNNGRGLYPHVARLSSAHMDRSTSPVDARILDEFYTDLPRDMHSYDLDGRRYVVYEGKTFGDINVFRRDLTQAMLSQDPQGLREAISRAKSSNHSSALADEIRQAQALADKL